MRIDVDQLRQSMRRRTVDELRAIVASPDDVYTPEARHVASEELARQEAVVPESVDVAFAKSGNTSTLEKIGAVIGIIVVMRMMVKAVMYFFG